MLTHYFLHNLIHIFIFLNGSLSDENICCLIGYCQWMILHRWNSVSFYRLNLYLLNFVKLFGKAFIGETSLHRISEKWYRWNNWFNFQKYLISISLVIANLQRLFRLLWHFIILKCVICNSWFRSKSHFHNLITWSRQFSKDWVRVINCQNVAILCL